MPARVVLMVTLSFESFATGNRLLHVADEHLHSLCWGYRHTVFSCDQWNGLCLSSSVMVRIAYNLVGSHAGCAGLVLSAR